MTTKPDPKTPRKNGGADGPRVLTVITGHNPNPSPPGEAAEERVPSAGEQEFYVLSLKWTRREDCLTWWGPNASGYTWLLEHAGRYTEADVKSRAEYLNNGESTVAIPCDVVEQFASRVVLQGSSYSLMSAAFRKPTSLIGSTVDDSDVDDAEECSECGRGYRHAKPGPSRIIHHAEATKSRNVGARGSSDGGNHEENS